MSAPWSCTHWPSGWSWPVGVWGCSCGGACWRGNSSPAAASRRRWSGDRASPAGPGAAGMAAGCTPAAWREAGAWAAETSRTWQEVHCRITHGHHHYTDVRKHAAAVGELKTDVITVHQRGQHVNLVNTEQTMRRRTDAARWRLRAAMWRREQGIINEIIQKPKRKWRCLRVWSVCVTNSGLFSSSSMRSACWTNWPVDWLFAVKKLDKTNQLDNNEPLFAGPPLNTLAPKWFVTPLF